MQWNKMSRRQQDTARRLSDDLIAAGVLDATRSQVAKYFDQAMDWQRGALGIGDLCEATGWDKPQPKATECTARQLAERLGVSLTTAYRRIRAGVHKARKDERGRWVVTYIAN